MKKVVFCLLFSAVAVVSYAQKAKTKFGWKIGLLTSLPADNDVPATRVTLGSTFGDVTYPLSKKVTAVGNLAYIKYKDNEGKSFSQIPVWIGAKYSIDSQFYFGASSGICFYNKGGNGTDFQFSPYVGMQIKKISVDARYINTVRTEPTKVIALVFSYTL
jgi:hypothetical protein